jgi:nitrate/TMAO reductase-like tetraheme cytochrome c subunit
MLAGIWNWFWQPTVRYTWGAIFIVGGIAGVIFWGGFHTAMEATNTMEFCISCHEMEENVYTEYKQTVHYQNRTGVRATCSDCHVPDPWVHKIIRKVQASNELLHKALGTVDTPEKFEAKRLTLAKNVWKAMKETDSRECRNCHSWDAMKTAKQKRRATKRHKAAQAEGQTCIDCHKGIAHRPVHKLLGEDDDPYDGKPDDRRLPSKAVEAAAKAKLAADKATAKKIADEATKLAAEQAAAKQAADAAAKSATPAPSSGGGDGDWAGVKPVDVVMLYPGQTSLEWVLKGSDHGGGRAVRRAGDRCQECHKGEQADMGNKIVTGEKAEPTPIPGKRGSIKVAVQARHDGTNLLLRFQWPDAGHTPAPFADGGKMDPDNQIKLAVMFDDGKVDMAEQAGCWVTCHNDSRYMPDAPKAEVLAASEFAKIIDLTDGVTKYTKDSRTKLEYKGKNGKPRGAWDKLIDTAEMDAKHKEGAFMDLVRYKSKGNKMEIGYIQADRKLKDAEKVSGIGKLENGTWTVTLSRPLVATQPGGVSFEPDKTYTIGIAIHDDYTTARFHHVSLEYRLALDNPEAEINVVKQ